jgi:protein arginine kinase activator
MEKHMLCENCKEREATVHFTEIMNGRVQKHHLCKECAAQMEMMGYASNEVPFVKLLTGMLAAGQTQEQGENPLQYVRCPKCGMTYEEFTRVGKFGCAECIDVFGPLIGDHMKKLHGSDTHTGKTYTKEKMQPETKQEQEQQDIDTLFCQTIERRKRQEKILAEQGLLSKEKQKTDKNITKWLDERKWKLKEAGFEAVKEDFYRETLKLKHQEEQIRMLLDKELGDVKNSSKTGQELPLFLSMLSQNEKIAEFIAEHRCESYLKESKALLLQEREAALKEEIQAFQTN